MGDPEVLKKRYGKQLTFYSNLCNQSILPHGTPDEVWQDVSRKIRALAPGGGYIMSAGHNIQADVPPENVLAAFDAAWQVGRYPLAQINEPCCGRSA
jgi:uroporphyrinogen decarboxylase